jgi:hypothetical protein
MAPGVSAAVGNVAVADKGSAIDVRHALVSAPNAGSAVSKQVVKKSRFKGKSVVGQVAAVAKEIRDVIRLEDLLPSHSFRGASMRYGEQ